MVDDVVGTVSGLWRFPVKSMLGEQPESIDIAEHGVVGDRAYALVDTETGKVVSAKHPRRWPQMFQCRAAFVEPPAAGQPLPPVCITLPDGSSVSTDDPDVDAILSGALGGAVTEQKLGAAFFADAGMPSAVPEGSFFDLFPVLVLTSSTLDQLAKHSPESTFDARRFRMNVIVDTAEEGFVENGWLGRRLTIGDGTALAVMIPDPRCVMTILAQEDLPKDKGILQTVARHNRIDVAGQGLFPCAGVYAVVESSGTIRNGDNVALS